MRAWEPLPAASGVAQRIAEQPSVSASDDAMRADTLIDTGAILALLDRTDCWLRVCVDVFRKLGLPLLTSEAVLTDCFTS